MKLLYFQTWKLAEKTMWGKFQKALQMSPWFLERGTVTGRTNLVYQPNKEKLFEIGEKDIVVYKYHRREESYCQPSDKFVHEKELKTYLSDK